VNEVTLFRHFGTKEHLIEAVVGSAFGQEKRPAEGRALGLRADLESFAARYEALLVENLPLVRTMIGEIHRHAVCQQQALKGIFWPMREALVRRIALACRKGEVRAGLNPAVVADLFAGAILASVLRRATFRRLREYADCDYTSAWVDVFLNGIKS
jgi:AcrR family transcriptional regulator